MRPILVRTLDTTLPFGTGTLDDHAKTFVGAEKAKGIGKEKMGQMLEVFRRTPRRAYYYAILDVILTLLVAERMAEEDHKMYETLGFDAQDIPALRPTLGSRVAEMITRAVARHASGSVKLSRRCQALKSGVAGTVSMHRVKALLQRGSGEFIAAEGRSRFGRQTGETHGGLLFT